ncbi:calcium-binding protein [Actinomadura parmotrematis]|uniref:Calcium-binding protein n=1 Tax=Actinomadura parmotrematis TaxID=2864039 RepID=A0ABS7G2Y7_9ACTN|nr:hypothetical protein [Actinomadura parmotrematis]MBW8486836.1 hypothetical protein [Actinomadura parmotrematis]
MTRHNGRGRALRALALTAGLAALPVALAAPPASANPCYGDCKPGVVRVGAGVLRYDAPVGAADQITIAPGAGFLSLTDATATFSAGDGCTMVSAHEAHCTTPAFSVRVRGLDGNDAITNSTALPSSLLGGTGDDRLTGGSADDTLTGETGADVLLGGGGSDTAGYDESSVRVGVQADLDGAAGDDGGPEDGPAGARDTIGADVENLLGSQGDDVLTGNAGPNVIGGVNGHDQIQGLGGNDQLTGRGEGTVNGGAGTDACVSDLRGLPFGPDTFSGCESTQILT